MRQGSPACLVVSEPIRVPPCAQPPCKRSSSGGTCPSQARLRQGTEGRLGTRQSWGKGGRRRGHGRPTRPPSPPGDVARADRIQLKQCQSDPVEAVPIGSS